MSKIIENGQVRKAVPNCIPQRPRPTTNCLKRFEELIDEIWSTNDGSIFRYPVDTILLGFHNYYDHIKHPMDLNSIKMRLENKYYQTVHEATADFAQMLQNCFQYYSPDHIVYEHGVRLFKLFERELELLPKIEIVIDMDMDEDEQNNEKQSSSYQRNKNRYENIFLKRKILSAKILANGKLRSLQRITSTKHLDYRKLKMKMEQHKEAALELWEQQHKETPSTKCDPCKPTYYNSENYEF